MCSECSEEFCSGTCKEFQYDAYQRLVLQEKEEMITETKDKEKGKKSSSKKKKRRKSKRNGKSKTKVTNVEEMPVV